MDRRQRAVQTSTDSCLSRTGQRRRREERELWERKALGVVPSQQKNSRGRERRCVLMGDKTERDFSVGVISSC